ncbi:MAG: uroporphyrinogen-III C-methyltransferase [Desulfobacterales bacterium]|nr:uroporphyrinogen-III C-methyltransferase [Desulfobacterales bacterium]
MKNQKGTVYLIGAGPGDPGLITVKGAECIRRADVVVYDYLASPTLLGYARKEARKIYVGKKGGDHTLSQEGINDLLVEKAAAGLNVARLKGGDPFIFGRGGEEAEALVQAGICFEIVPGVTSAVAAPAYAGIPLTHRQFTSTLAFVTGHEDPGKEESSIDWEAVSKIGTQVYFMGVKNLPKIVARLLANGMPRETGAALVRWGTTPLQQTVAGTLEDIVEKAETAGIKAPAIIVVGNVVALRDSLRWFEDRPLLGKRIVVTRAREQASSLVQTLTDLGAAVLECPTIEVIPPESWEALDAAIEQIAGYQWLVFTSVNGVRYFFHRLFERSLDVRALGHLGTCAIGPATAEALLTFGMKTDVLPKSYRAESIVASFRSLDVAGKRILLPRAEEARPVLPMELAKMGALVDEVTAYRTRAAEESKELLLESLEEGAVDMVTFTSSSTVRNFKSLLPAERMTALMAPVTVASIGPITTETAESEGFKVGTTAETFTIPGLVAAILDHYGRAENSFPKGRETAKNQP